MCDITLTSTQAVFCVTNFIQLNCQKIHKSLDVSEADEFSAYEYGKSLGIAFQMTDDLLDYVSTSSVTGKPTANDLKLGKSLVIQ